MLRCPICHGPGQYIGTLGHAAHFTCRNCGWRFAHHEDDILEDEAVGDE